MNYKTPLFVIVFYSLLCIGTTNLIAQEKNASDLIALIETYDSLDENTEKDEALRKIKDLVKNIPKDSLEFIVKHYDFNFIARFAMADYYRLNKNHDLAKREYAALEPEILSKRPIDYILLAHVVWASSTNISLKNFSYNKGIKELNRGLGYAQKSQVEKMIIRFHSNLAFYYGSVADYEQYIYHNKKEYDLAKKLNDSLRMIYALKSIMENFNATNNSESSLKIWSQIQPIFKNYTDYPYPGQLLAYPTVAFINSKQYDSAAYYNAQSFYLDSIKGYDFRKYYNLLEKGKILLGLEKKDDAEDAFKMSYQLSREGNNKVIQVVSSAYLSRLYIDKGEYEKALELLRLNYNISKKQRGVNKSQFELLLSRVFEANKILDSALYYRNLSDESLKTENQTIHKKQVALAKAELGINELLDENENLVSTQTDLDKRMAKSKTTTNVLLYALLTIVILTSFFIYRRNQKEKLRVSQYREELTNKERIAIEAELNTIRSQMNPHFMFNSLNSINEFIQNDSSEDASNYLVKFSRLMRSTLNYSKRKFVTLKEEIDLLKLYIELENLRFYNSIDFSLTIDPSINTEKALIPPMMIQPFVENAIWHGLMAKENERKLKLTFSENQQHIICNIEDNGIGRTASAQQKAQKPKHKSQGIGLTQRRLELLKSIHGNEAGIEVIDLTENGTGTLVKVILPKQLKE